MVFAVTNEERIRQFEKQNPPFILYDHKDGSFSLGLPFTFLEGRYKNYGQEAFNRYAAYVQRGILQLSGDNFVDYHDCFNWFKMLVEQYQIYPLKVGYDRYTAQYLVQEMKQYGFHMDDVFQGYNLTPVIQETEGLMKDGAFYIGDNDLLKVHLLNMALKTETESGRSKPIKMSTNDHIDGGAALLDAMTVRQKYYAEIGGQLKNAG